MGDESLISWNLPNFITVVLMLAVSWVLIGGAAHMIFGRKRGKPAIAGTPQPMAGSPMADSTMAQ